jgi:periplasmic copper chaperone A
MAMRARSDFRCEPGVWRDMTPAGWLIAALCLMLGSAPAAAGDKIEVQYPWVRPSIGGGSATTLYLALNNWGDVADELTAISTPAASTAQLHQSADTNGVVTMTPVHSLPLPPHTIVSLEPKGTHVMLMGLTKPLRVGERIPITLHFKVAHDIVTTADVSMAHPPVPSLID